MKRLITLLFAVFTVQLLCAQPDLKRADKLFDCYHYTRAIEKYQKHIKKFPDDEHALYRLAECYRLTANAEQSEKWYARLVAINPAKSEYKYELAQAMMVNEKYAEAKKYLESYHDQVMNDERAKAKINALENIEAYQADQGIFKIQKLGFNTEQPEFGPAIYKNGLVFVSVRENTQWIRRTHGWTGASFLDLYQARGSKTTFRQAEKFLEEMETKFNDGPVCFNSDFSEMYLTRNNIYKGKVGKGDDESVRLQIYKGKRVGGKWELSYPFRYNNDNYNVAHASLSHDGEYLYFASDKPGGYGGMDIYVCKKRGKAWAEPVNLGPVVNSKGNEVFPFIGVDGSLFYSSDGQDGLGGLDIYMAFAKKDKWVESFNIGKPMNSNADDFGIVFSEDMASGFMSSNRKGGRGGDDIYAFTRTVYELNGLVYDEETGEPLDDAEVKITSSKTPTKEFQTGMNGKFRTNVKLNREFVITVRREGYEDKVQTITSAVRPGKRSINVRIGMKGVPMFVLKGKVYKMEDNSIVPNAQVLLTNKTTGKVSKTLADEKGYYTFNLDKNTEYVVSTSLEKCAESSQNTSTKGLRNTTTLYADLGMFCEGDIIRIDNIYYDYNKWNIRSDAALVLDDLVSTLNEYSTIKIEMRSHTDARGRDSYNETLSQKRAQSAVNYLIKNGINRSRLVAKGYGEYKLLNRCADGVKCSEEEHQENRRTEFKILSID